MPKAKQEELEELHGSLCRELKAALDGNSDKPAALLNTIRQFLSDNNIEADITPGDPSEFLDDDHDFQPPELDDEPANSGGPEGESTS